jgi:hypothetical protein
VAGTRQDAPGHDEELIHALMDLQTDRQLCGWIALWAQFLVLGLCAILGIVAAARGGGTGDYGSGMVLTLAAIIVAFLRIKRQFDGGDTGWSAFLFVERMQSLWLVVPVFTMLGLAGLFLAAAWQYGSLHDSGIALFAVSGLAVFLSIKRVFDRLDSH